MFYSILQPTAPTEWAFPPDYPLYFRAVLSPTWDLPRSDRVKVPDCEGGDLGVTDGWDIPETSISWTAATLRHHLHLHDGDLPLSPVVTGPRTRLGNRYQLRPISFVSTCSLRCEGFASCSLTGFMLFLLRLLDRLLCYWTCSNVIEVMFIYLRGNPYWRLYVWIRE